MASTESFYDKSKRLEAELSEVDNRICRIVRTNSDEIYMRDSQIRILEQQLKNSNKSLKEMTALYNESNTKIKKLNSINLFFK